VLGSGKKAAELTKDREGKKGLGEGIFQERKEKTPVWESGVDATLFRGR